MLPSNTSTELDLPSMAEQRCLERRVNPVRARYKQRSHPLNTYEHSRAQSLIERKKHTFEFKLNETKDSIRTKVISGANIYKLPS